MLSHRDATKYDLGLGLRLGLEIEIEIEIEIVSLSLHNQGGEARHRPVGRARDKSSARAVREDTSRSPLVVQKVTPPLCSTFMNHDGGSTWHHGQNATLCI